MDQGDEKEQERFEDFVGVISALSKEIQRIKMVEAAKLGIKGADVMLLYQLAPPAGAYQRGARPAMRRDARRRLPRADHPRG